MIERGGDARFVQKPLFRSFVQAPRGWQELERGGSAEPHIRRSVDHAHAARAEQRVHTVTAHGRADHAERITLATLGRRGE